MVTICTTLYNIQKLCILLTRCTYAFRMILRINVINWLVFIKEYVYLQMGKN
jgi:hypothetical protein